MHESFPCYNISIKLIVLYERDETFQCELKVSNKVYIKIKHTKFVLHYFFFNAKDILLRKIVPK